ncbi:MAG: hypothetical protein IKA61_04065 [Clostridia bacterium]|nr:hypothetical protein [Clostridia bacterium]
MSDQFNYKYTAPTAEERKEIDSIRRQYSPREQTETKIERLRRLDALVKNTATVWSLVFGVIGCLIFGLGLTMVLEWANYQFGIPVMVIGSFPMAIAYPIYKGLLKKNKKRYGAEILRLSEELLNEDGVKEDNV